MAVYSPKRHKHKNSNAVDDFLGHHFEEGVEETQLQALIPGSTNSANITMRKTPSKNLDDKSTNEQHLQATAACSFPVGSEVYPEALFSHSGTRVKASLTRIGVQLTANRPPCLPCVGRAVLGLVPYEEILGVNTDTKLSWHIGTCCTSKVYQLILHTIKRSRRNASSWRQRQISLSTEDAEVVQEWSAHIRAALRQQVHRPKSLLVIINPFGGARKALQIWKQTVMPVLDLAGTKYHSLVTEREGHARELMQQLSPRDMETYDGLIAVGGDGLFQEMMNGLLSLRAQGGQEGTAAQRMRLGHIPAGSTDAVAYSINGTRSQLTAALHIALGDRTGVDVMRVDTADGKHRFSICVASYGYMGDLMRTSEKLRWMGPSRYNTAGTLTLFKGRSYQARVSYKPADTSRVSVDARMVCRSRCNLCRLSPDTKGRQADLLAFTQPATAALEHGVWKTIEGRFKSIMAVVTPCRSDQSTLGLSPYGHLADGRLQLILVKDCSILDYLRFLISIPQTGVEPGAFPYVDVINVTAVQITPLGPESSWNVDGELLENNYFTGEVHRGLLDVFARGVE